MLCAYARVAVCPLHSGLYNNLPAWKSSFSTEVNSSYYSVGVVLVCQSIRDDIARFLIDLRFGHPLEVAREVALVFNDNNVPPVLHLGEGIANGLIGAKGLTDFFSRACRPVALFLGPLTNGLLGFYGFT